MSSQPSCSCPGFDPDDRRDSRKFAALHGKQPGSRTTDLLTGNIHQELDEFEQWRTNSGMYEDTEVTELDKLSWPDFQPYKAPMGGGACGGAVVEGKYIRGDWMLKEGDWLRSGGPPPNASDDRQTAGEREAVESGFGKDPRIKEWYCGSPLIYYGMNAADAPAPPLPPPPGRGPVCAGSKRSADVNYAYYGVPNDPAVERARIMQAPVGHPGCAPWNPSHKQVKGFPGHRHHPPARVMNERDSYVQQEVELLNSTAEFRTGRLPLPPRPPAPPPRRDPKPTEIMIHAKNRSSVLPQSVSIPHRVVLPDYGPNWGNKTCTYSGRGPPHLSSLTFDSRKEDMVDPSKLRPIDAISGHNPTDSGLQ